MKDHRLPLKHSETKGLVKRWSKWSIKPQTFWLDVYIDVSMVKGPKPQYVVGQKYLTTICCIKHILSP